MPAPRAISGKHARIRLSTSGVVVLVAGKWDLAYDGDDTDITSFEDQGWANVLATLDRATVTVDGFYDAANNPFDAPLNLKHGQRDLTVYLYLDYTKSPTVFAKISPAMVYQPKISAAPGDKISFSATFKSQGYQSSAYPTGNIPA